MQLCFVVPLYCRPYGGLWSTVAISKPPPLQCILVWLNVWLNVFYLLVFYLNVFYLNSHPQCILCIMSQCILSKTTPHWMYSCLTLALLWRPAHPLSRIMVEVPVMVVGFPLHIDNAYILLTILYNTLCWQYLYYNITFYTILNGGSPSHGRGLLLCTLTIHCNHSECTLTMQCNQN